MPSDYPPPHLPDEGLVPRRREVHQLADTEEAAGYPGHADRRRSLAKTIALGVAFFLPCIYFPCFYTVKEFLTGKSYNPLDWARDGVAKYVHNAPVDIRALWSFWGPGNILVFSVPLWLRMPVRHVLSLG